MKLTAKTGIHDLLVAHPFLEDFMASYHAKFEMLRHRMAYATIGRKATLRTVAGIASIELESLVDAIASKIEAETGCRPAIERLGEQPGMNREERIQQLKQIIMDLHDSMDVDQAKERFEVILEDVEASEIAEMEADLIRHGLTVSEVQSLCDVHVETFKNALDEHAVVAVAPGHPIHTYMMGNQVIARLANQLGSFAAEKGAFENWERQTSVEALLKALKGIGNHYERKETQLFRALARHGLTGLTQVMSGVHGQIRKALDEVAEATFRKDSESFAKTAAAFAHSLIEMVYKEEKILYPVAMEILNEREWAAIRRGEDRFGYEYAKPLTVWPPKGQGIREQ